jgi:hypothetical protein
MSSETESKRTSRRRFIATAGLASLSLAAPAMVRAQGKQALKVSVGRQPWAAGNSPVTQYMIANKTFERFAADAGYDLTIDYRDYPSALPMVEVIGLLAVNLSFAQGPLTLGSVVTTGMSGLLGTAASPPVAGRLPPVPPVVCAALPPTPAEVIVYILIAG